MKTFFKFVIAGLLINVPPEVVNQIYVKRSVSGFIQTAIVYMVFLALLYPVKKMFNRLVKSRLLNALVWYLLLGAFGLYIEWNLLGNRGAAWYGQIAMFTFWGSFGLVPMVFTEQPVLPAIKKGLIKYCLPWGVLYLFIGNLNPGLGLLIWIIGSVGLNYLFILYFWQLRSGLVSGDLIARHPKKLRLDPKAIR